MPDSVSSARLASSPPPAPTRSAWILTQGHVGHVIKCRGLADALGLATREVVIRLPLPWRLVAPYGRPKPPAELTGPYPDLIIASGRQTVPVARALRQASRGGSVVVYVDDPRIDPAAFDLVWASAHDAVRGPNVIRTLTAPHTMTAARRAAGAEALAPRLADAARGRKVVGVLLGGPSRAYRFDAAVAAKLAADLDRLARDKGAFLAITRSRRTPDEVMVVLKARLGADIAWIWDGDGDGENPYSGILGLADHFVVTADSTNMLGEAAATARPIHGWRLPGGSDRIETFHDGLVAHGALKWFDGRLDDWTYPPLDSTAEIARAVAERLGQARVRP